MPGVTFHRSRLRPPQLLVPLAHREQDFFVSVERRHMLFLKLSASLIEGEKLRVLLRLGRVDGKKEREGGDSRNGFAAALE